MIHIGLFEGIGGFTLSAEWAGWETLVTCEINPFGQKVLNYYWPNAYHHDDIHTLTYERINKELIQRFGEGWRNNDIIVTGGFPCQPYSTAGKRLGKDDNRHLWPEMLRTIREIQPAWVVGENVRGLVSWNGGMVFEEVQADLEAEGYEVLPVLLPACAVNAPHRRDRIWFVAHANKRTTESSRTRRKVESDRSNNNDEQGRRRESTEQHIGCSNVLQYATNTDNIRLQWHRGQRQGRHGLENNNSIAANPDSGRQPRKEYRKTESGRVTEAGIPGDWQNFPTQSPICSGNDGVPTELVGITVSKHRNESIKAAGNAIVPQIALEIFKAINLYNKSI